MKNYLSSAIGLTVFSLLISSPAMAAGLYKCMGDNNVPLYQNEPCPQGKAIRDMSKDDLVSVVPMVVPAPAPEAAVEGAAAPEQKPASKPAAKPVAKPVAKPTVPTGANGQVAQNRMSIMPGMKSADVKARIGDPMIVTGDGSDVAWVYLPVDGDSQTITKVFLKAGAVVSVERTPKK